MWEMIRLANRYPRVNILKAGPGVGDHYMSVDPWFIVHGAPENARLIRASRKVNDAKMHHMFKRGGALVADNHGLQVACLDLAFKANIDDSAKVPRVSSLRGWLAISARGSASSNPMQRTAARVRQYGGSASRY